MNSNTSLTLSNSKARAVFPPTLAQDHSFPSCLPPILFGEILRPWPQRAESSHQHRHERSAALPAHLEGWANPSKLSQSGSAGQQCPTHHGLAKRNPPCPAAPGSAQCRRWYRAKTEHPCPQNTGREGELLSAASNTRANNYSG